MFLNKTSIHFTSDPELLIDSTFRSMLSSIETLVLPPASSRASAGEGWVLSCMDSIFQTLAIILNKLPMGEKLQQYLRNIFSLLSTLSKDCCLDPKQHSVSVFCRLFVWVTRALMMRPDIACSAEDALAISSQYNSQSASQCSFINSSSSSSTTTTTTSWQELLIIMFFNILDRSQMPTSSYAETTLAVDARLEAEALVTQKRSKSNAISCQYPSSMIETLGALMGTLTGTPDLPIPSESAKGTVSYVRNMSLHTRGEGADGARFVLCTQSGCTRTLLWRQRLWSRLFSPLLSILRSVNFELHEITTGSTAHVLPTMRHSNGTNIPSFIRPEPVSSQESFQNDAYVRGVLLALCGLISGMPHSILSSSIPDVLIISIRALGISCEAYKHSAVNLALIAHISAADGINTLCQLRSQSLDTLLIIMNMSLEAFSSHIPTVVPLLILIAQKDELARVRVQALQVLLAMVATDVAGKLVLPYSRLYPLRKFLIKGLTQVIDDKKRAVRKLAARVRNEWSVVR